MRTTKKCPDCGNEDLVRLTSYNQKYCTVCNKYIEWVLTDGQQPIYSVRTLKKQEDDNGTNIKN